MFTSRGFDRAYLFSKYGDFVFGLVEGPFKEIYDFNRDRAELYNLMTDPAEMRDLSSDGYLLGFDGARSHEDGRIECIPKCISAQVPG